MEPKITNRPHGFFSMLPTENTGTIKENGEAGKPTFQSPLQLKAASTSYFGRQKGLDDPKQFEDDGLVLLSHGQLAVDVDRNIVQELCQSSADGASFTSAATNADNTADIIIDDDNFSWTTTSTVTGLVDTMALVEKDGRKNVAGREREASVGDDDGDSNWEDESDSENEGWILDLVARRRRLSRARPRIKSSAKLRTTKEGALDWKLTLACCEEASPHDEGELLVLDNFKTDCFTRVDLSHGDFQAGNGQNSVFTEIENTPDSITEEASAVRKEEVVEAGIEDAVNAILEETDNPTTEEVDYSQLEDAVDSWIEEARIEAEMLMGCKDRHLDKERFKDDCLEVQSELNSQSAQTNLDETEHSAVQQSLITNYAETHSAEMISADDNFSEMISAEVNFAATSSAEMNLAEINNTGWRSADMNSTESNSSENNFAELQLAVISSTELGFAEMHFAEIKSTENNDAGTHCAENSTALQDSVKVDFPEIKSAETNSAEVQTAVTKQSDQNLYDAHFADTIFSESITAEFDSGIAKFSEMQTPEMRSVEIQTCDFDISESKSAETQFVDAYSSETDSSAFNYADTNPGDSNPSDTDAGDTASEDTDSEDTSTTDMENANANLTDTESSEMEFVETHFAALNPADTNSAGSPRKYSADLARNIFDHQRPEDEQRGWSEPAVYRYGLKAVVRYTLGTWMSLWGPRSFQ